MPPLLRPLPPHTSSITVLARCTTHCCREAKGTAHGFITDGRQGWRHARALFDRSLACPLSEVRISMLPACPLSHTQRSSAKLACLPITNHRRRPWVREACPLLCLTCSWRLLGVFLDLAFARVHMCSIYSAFARDHQPCSRIPSACICSSSIAHHRDYCQCRRLFSRSPDRPACARPVGEDVQIRCSPRPITNAVGSSMQIV